jgi:ribosomal silencing factor RsfS
MCTEFCISFYGCACIQAEDKLKAISAEMAKAREREAEQHAAAEGTQARLTLMSSASIVVLLFVSGWQMQYLKFFFRSKKLL